MSKPMTMQEFFARFPDDETCLSHLMKTRYGEKLDCPKCGRHGKFHRHGKERAYSCQWCGHHIHPTVGTPMERSRTSLQRWFYAMAMDCFVPFAWRYERRSGLNTACWLPLP